MPGSEGKKGRKNEGKYAERIFDDLLRALGKVSPEELADLRLLSRCIAQAYLTVRPPDIELAEELGNAGMASFLKKRDEEPELFTDELEIERLRRNATQSSISNYGRTGKRTRKHQPRLTEETAEWMESQSRMDEEDEVEPSQELLALRVALGRLSPQMREVVLKKFGHEATYPEIATALGHSLSVVEKRGSRGFKKLKELAQESLKQLRTVQS